MSLAKIKKPDRQIALSGAIAAARSQTEILAALKHVTTAFGFSYVSLITKPARDDMLLSRAIIESTLPISYINAFDDAGLLGACPVMPTLFTSMLPQAWTLDELEAELGSKLPAEMARLMRKFELLSSAVMPFRSLEGDPFLLRFDGKRAPLEQVEINELGMISLHAFDAFDQLRRAEIRTTPIRLSSRELEVVRWTAQGKTSVEIGRILCLSDHTVNAHMTNAIKKMDCVNRTQLVAKAIRLGLIA